MAIYRAKIRGEKTPRYVKAGGRREAVDHFLTLESLNADEVEELVGGDTVVERIGDPEPATEDRGAAAEELEPEDEPLTPTPDDAAKAGGKK